MSRINIDIKELSDKYKSGLSASVLASHYDVSVWSVITRLRKFGIEIRKNQNEIFINLTSENKRKFLDIVDGLLLGDGSIDLHKSFLRLEQCEARYCWIEQVSRCLYDIGCDHKILPIKPRIRQIEGRQVKSKPANLLYTRSYSEFKYQKSRWYPEGKKRVPRDLILSPVTMAHWFAGDGTYNSNGILSFCTNGFVREDTEYLAESLCKLDIESNIMNTCREGQFTIGIYKIEDVLRLKDMIEPFLPECCKYKLRFVRSSRKH